MAAWGRLRSLGFLPKYTWEACFTPVAPEPRKVVFRYISRISSLLHRASTNRARAASAAFRFTDWSEVSSRFFTSCWVMVLAPSTTSSFWMFTRVARMIPSGSTPWWE